MRSSKLKKLKIVNGENILKKFRKKTQNRKIPGTCEVLKKLKHRP